MKLSGREMQELDDMFFDEVGELDLSLRRTGRQLAALIVRRLPKGLERATAVGQVLDAIHIAERGQLPLFVPSADDQGPPLAGPPYAEREHEAEPEPRIAAAGG